MGENNEHTCEMIKYFGYYIPFAKMVEISIKMAFDHNLHPFLLLDIERPKMEGVNYPIEFYLVHFLASSV
jgi:hypothetical protein